MPADPHQFPPWFFISHARGIHNLHVNRFRSDLALRLKSIARIGDTDDQNLGYLDVTDIPAGSIWPTELGKALRLSSVLVPLYSPKYFERKVCGQEFQSFFKPESAFEQWPGGRRPILPVYWTRVSASEWPENREIRDLQAEEGNFPQEYRDHGLYYLMDVPSCEDAYKKFLWAFATRLKQLAGTAPDAHTMPLLRDHRNIPSAFHVGPDSAPAVREIGPSKLARFICAAGTVGQIASGTGVYGNYGGIDWAPFAPSDNTTISLIAIEAAFREGFVCDRYGKLDGGAPVFLNQAESEGALVIILVDPWSLALNHYRAAITPCDQPKPGRAVVVVLNSEHAPTIQSADDLRDIVAAALPTLGVTYRNENFFREQPDTKSGLQSQIQVVLAKMHSGRVAAQAAKLRATAGSPPLLTNARTGGTDLG